MSDVEDENTCVAEYNLKNAYIEPQLILDYNKKFKSINRSQNKEIGTFYEILKDFNKYLYDINYLSNLSYLINLLTEEQTAETINPLKQIRDNINEINKYYYSLYKSIDISEKSHKFIELTYIYIEIIWRSLLIFYQFYYINKNKNKNNTKKKLRITSSIRSSKSERILKPNRRSLSSSSLRKKTLPIKPLDESFDLEGKLNEIKWRNILNIYYKIIKLNKKIIDDELNNSIEFYNGYDNEEKKENIFEMFNIIYKLILINFNKFFFNYSSYNYVSPTYNFNPSILEFLNKIDVDDDNLLFIRNLLIKSYNKFKKINTSLLRLTENKYITIPQYVGNCWFISFLTGLTYSDKNKALLKKKREINERSGTIIELSDITDTTDTNIIFNSFVYYIIDKITNEFKKYSSDLIEDCELFQNLKKYPEYFLKKLIEDELNKQEKITRTNKKKIKKYYEKKIKENYGNPDNYIYDIIIAFLSGSGKYKYGADRNYYIILKKFYDYLNINCLFVYNINNEKYATIEEGKTYDIIIISNNSITDTLLHHDRIGQIERNSTNITLHLKLDETLKNIIYNGEEYELDFVMHSSDDKKSCGGGCFHNICALHYDSKEYYYNSAYYLEKLNSCSTEDIKLPCSLIKKDWSSSLNKEYCFSLLKCSYIPDYEYYDKINEIAKIVINNSLNTCYSNESGGQYCYVRKNSISGGKGMKKEIERKVYLDKKLNKYYVNYDNKKIYLEK